MLMASTMPLLLTMIIMPVMIMCMRVAHGMCMLIGVCGIPDVHAACHSGRAQCVHGDVHLACDVHTCGVHMDMLCAGVCMCVCRCEVIMACA